MSGATKHRKLKRMGWILLGVAVLLLAVGLVALSSARVEMTANGVHTRLMVPLGALPLAFPSIPAAGRMLPYPISWPGLLSVVTPTEAGPPIGFAKTQSSTPRVTKIHCR